MAKYLEHRIFTTSEMSQYLLTPLSVHACVKCYLYLDILVIFVKNFLVMINLCLYKFWWACLPGVGLWPKIPLYIAGTRIEPATSEATPITDAPEAISTAYKKICLKRISWILHFRNFFTINLAWKKHIHINGGVCWWFKNYTKLSIM